MEDGIGLAAPQVGIFRKIMLCREMNGAGWEYDFTSQFRLYINPNFEPVQEDGKWNHVEYCLSVPGKGFEIARWKKIVATWVEPDEEGNLFSQEKILEGWAARLFLHEFDQLNGISIPQRHQLQNKPQPQKSKRKKKRKR